MAEVGPMVTQADVVLMDAEVTEEEEIRAALNILDYFEDCGGRSDRIHFLYPYLYILAVLGLTAEEFDPVQMAELGLNNYMETIA